MDSQVQQPVKKGRKNPFRIINRALKEAEVKGIDVAAKDWGVMRGKSSRWELWPDGVCACPLGLVLLGKKASGYGGEVDACKILSVSKDWVESFIAGVDNDSSLPGNKKAYNFGQRIHAKYAL